MELVNEIAFSEALIEEREQGIQEIQQQISEVNEIFKDLAVLVHDQGTMIGNLSTCTALCNLVFYYRIATGVILVAELALRRADDIGSHIENSQAATANGKSHLVKAAKIQKSNSSLVLNDGSSLVNQFLST